MSKLLLSHPDSNHATPARLTDLNALLFAVHSPR
jgi:hypothetical protein